jgi:hypothetical protein
MSDTMQISFNTDSGGFISQECPNCLKHFKVKFGEGSDQPLRYCPYCGHQGKDCWWTQAQSDYIGSFVSGELLDPAMKDMAKQFNRSSSRNSFLSIKMDYKPSPKAQKPDEPETNWPIFNFVCCNEQIKHNNETQRIYCVICGKQYNVADQE